MMTGERLGIGHEPQHGTAYLQSWIQALENGSKKIRAAAVDAQRISDWLMARSCRPFRVQFIQVGSARPLQRRDGGPDSCRLWESRSPSRRTALVRGCGQASALQTVEPVTYRCGTRRVCQARSSGSERYTRARPHAVAPMNCVPEDPRRRSTCTGRTHSPRALAEGASVIKCW